MELNNNLINLNGIQIKIGSSIYTGNGNSYIYIFKTSDLKQMFNISDEDFSATKCFVYAYNGDDQALGNIQRGIVYNEPNKGWIMYFTNNIASGKKCRINWIVGYMKEALTQN